LARVVHSPERIDKAEVTGSSPVSPTTESPAKRRVFVSRGRIRGRILRVNGGLIPARTCWALSVIVCHATITMTFDTYGHLMPGGLDEAAAATNAYLVRLSGGRPALSAVR
jgi:hypothetical protein